MKSDTYLTTDQIEADFGIPAKTINASSLPRVKRNGRNYFHRVDVNQYAVRREAYLYRRQDI